MVAWSSIRSTLAPSQWIRSALKPNSQKITLKSGIQIRQMCDHGPRTMPIQPSRFMWNKWKDYTHFYVLVGAIPLCTLVFFVNVFIGPGTLSPIPEGYRPQPWEYYKHPITRFFAKWLLPPSQQNYEKYLHHIFVEDQKIQLRFLEEKVMRLMKERRDHKAYYYLPVSAKHLRLDAERVRRLEGESGNN